MTVYWLLKVSLNLLPDTSSLLHRGKIELFYECACMHACVWVHACIMVPPVSLTSVVAVMNSWQKALIFQNGYGDWSRTCRWFGRRSTLEKKSPALSEEVNDVSMWKMIWNIDLKCHLTRISRHHRLMLTMCALVPWPIHQQVLFKKQRGNNQ